MKQVQKSSIRKDKRFAQTEKTYLDKSASANGTQKNDTVKNRKPHSFSSPFKFTRYVTIYRIQRPLYRSALGRSNHFDDYNNYVESSSGTEMGSSKDSGSEEPSDL